MSKDTVPPYVSLSSMKSQLSGFGTPDLKLTDSGYILINQYLDEMLSFVITTRSLNDQKLNSKWIEKAIESLLPNSNLAMNLIEYASYGLISIGNGGGSERKDSLHHTGYFMDGNNKPDKGGPNTNGKGIGPNNYILNPKYSMNCDTNPQPEYLRIKSSTNATKSLTGWLPNLMRPNSSDDAQFEDRLVTRGIYAPKTLYECMRSMCLYYSTLSKKQLDTKWRPSKLAKKLVDINTAVYMSRILEHTLHSILVSSIQRIRGRDKEYQEYILENPDSNVETPKPLLDHELVMSVLTNDSNLSPLTARLNFKTKIERGLAISSSPPVAASRSSMSNPLRPKSKNRDNDRKSSYSAESSESTSAKPSQEFTRNPDLSSGQTDTKISLLGARLKTQLKIHTNYLLKKTPLESPNPTTPILSPVSPTTPKFKPTKGLFSPEKNISNPEKLSDSPLTSEELDEFIDETYSLASSDKLYPTFYNQSTSSLGSSCMSLNEASPFDQILKSSTTQKMSLTPSRLRFSNQVLNGSMQSLETINS